MLENVNNILKFYRLSKEVQIPTYATDGAAAFDLRVFLDGSSIECYRDNNEVAFQYVPLINPELILWSNWRYKIPTGLILDIPEGYRVDVNLRGGTAFKTGLILCNSTGIIDWDYVNELFICVMNTTENSITIQNGERIAQAKLERKIHSVLEELYQPPGKKTQRTGGFNSTGIF